MQTLQAYLGFLKMTMPLWHAQCILSHVPLWRDKVLSHHKMVEKHECQSSSFFWRSPVCRRWSAKPEAITVVSLSCPLSKDKHEAITLKKTLHSYPYPHPISFDKPRFWKKCLPRQAYKKGLLTHASNWNVSFALSRSMQNRFDIRPCLFMSWRYFHVSTQEYMADLFPTSTILFLPYIFVSWQTLSNLQGLFLFLPCYIT